MLTVESVSKRFRQGNYGVRELSLSIDSGVLGLLGPNGAGKTTLMQMIATITRPTAGRITFDGEDEERVRFRNVLSELGFGKLVILSTHIVSDIESVATQIAIMKEGRLVTLGAPEELLRAVDGAVWEWVMPSEEFERRRAELRISSAVRRADGVHARMTFAAMPVAIVAALGFAIAALASSPSGIRGSILPLAFATAAVFIADIPCRERRAGTLGLAFAAPIIKSRFIAWKLLASITVAAAFVFVPAVLASRTDVALLPATIIGVLFIAAMSTALGVASSNPKSFIVLFLTFFYVVMNDKGSPHLDFAGFHDVATPAVTASYAAVAVLATVAAEVFHRARLRREQ